MTEDEIQTEIVTARLQGNKISFAEILRDEIVEGTIKRVRPFPIFKWLDVGPVERACTALGLPSPYTNNKNFDLLRLYHCRGYFGIPRAIRRRIPDLIREILKGGGQ